MTDDWRCALRDHDWYYFMYYRICKARGEPPEDVDKLQGNRTRGSYAPVQPAGGIDTTGGEP